MRLADWVMSVLMLASLTLQGLQLWQQRKPRKRGKHRKG